MRWCHPSTSWWVPPRACSDLRGTPIGSSSWPYYAILNFYYTLGLKKLWSSRPCSSFWNPFLKLQLPGFKGKRSQKMRGVRSASAFYQPSGICFKAWRGKRMVYKCAPGISNPKWHSIRKLIVPPQKKAPWYFFALDVKTNRFWGVAKKNHIKISRPSPSSQLKTS